jgi:hypothetical protein
MRGRPPALVALDHECRGDGIQPPVRNAGGAEHHGQGSEAVGAGIEAIGDQGREATRRPIWMR